MTLQSLTPKRAASLVLGVVLALTAHGSPTRAEGSTACSPVEGATPAAASGMKILDLRIFRNSPLTLLVQTPNKLEVWTMPGAEMPAQPWRLAGSWALDPDHLSAALTFFGDNRLVVVSGADGTGLYSVDAPARPVIAGLPNHIISVWRLRATTAAGTSAFAMSYTGTGPSNGPSFWAIYSHSAGEHWSRLALPDGENEFLGFVRLGDAEVAVLPRPMGRGWQLLKLDDHGGWAPMQVPGAPSQIGAVQAFDPPRGMALQQLAKRGADQEAAKWNWFYKDRDGAWLDIHSAIPGIPATIRQIQVLETPDLLAIEDQSRTAGFPEPTAWHYYVLSGEDSWTELRSTVLSAPRIFNIKVWSSGPAIAYQQVEDVKSGEHALYWTLRRYANGSWASVDGLFDGAPKQIWDIDGFANGQAVEFVGADPASPGNAFAREWFVKLRDRWVNLSSVLPSPPTQILQVRSDRLDEGLAVQDGPISATPFQWRWFLPTDGGYCELNDQWGRVAIDRSIPTSVQLPESDNRNLREGVLAAKDVGGNLSWFVNISGNRWVPSTTLVLP